jgi:SNF2 family DNA or RNA helicase
MKYEPRPYQIAMQQHMFDVLRCGCWAGMGLGKSVSTLTALDLQQEFADERGKTLVLAPLRVAQSTWPDEVRKWDHLKNLEISVMTGSLEERRRALRQDANIYTMNYENIPWLIDEVGDRWPFRTVVADESTRLKSFRLSGGGLRAKALGKVAHKHVKQWINLTGTPAPNGLQDLWGQTWFLDAGQRLGRTYRAFCERWFTQDYNGYGWRPLEFAQETIQDRLADICLSIDAKHHFDLPDLIVNNIYVDLPRLARARYDEMEREMFTMLAGEEVEAFNAASRTIKCLQLASGAVYLPEDEALPHEQRRWVEVHSTKIDALESIVEESAGAPLLVAYHFKSDLARLRKAFPKARELDKDPRTITDWNAGRIPILLAHPQSAGHGLNLQDGGCQIAFFSHDWNLENYQQIIERIGPVRQAQAGHPRPVTVHHIIARRTVDELVMARRESKRDVQEILMDAMRKAA